MRKEAIIACLPYESPFLFVDELLQVDDSGAVGTFTFQEDMDFYRGHFKENPVTPGVILTECCAQIGLVCLGIFLLNRDMGFENTQIGMSSAQMEFYRPVFPGEKVMVTSKKIYFRFKKIKCEVRMENSKGDLICKGVLAGMLTSDSNG